jgi:hypothetical protein
MTKPAFSEEENTEAYVPKSSLKPVGKSMFDNQPKRPNRQEFEKRVGETQDRLSGYNKRAASLFLQFSKTMEDKTLTQHKNIFNRETENELLKEIIKLSQEMNNDQNESEGAGSIASIILLFKTCISQRDKYNDLAYNVAVLQKKLEPESLEKVINEQVSKALDSKKING